MILHHVLVCFFGMSSSTFAYLILHPPLVPLTPMFYCFSFYLFSSLHLTTGFHFFQLFAYHILFNFYILFTLSVPLVTNSCFTKVLVLMMVLDFVFFPLLDFFVAQWRYRQLCLLCNQCYIYILHISSKLPFVVCRSLHIDDYAKLFSQF